MIERILAICPMLCLVIGMAGCAKLSTTAHVVMLEAKEIGFTIDSVPEHLIQKCSEKYSEHFSVLSHNVTARHFLTQRKI